MNNAKQKEHSVPLKDKIFSKVKTDTHKIIRILGIKISIKRPQKKKIKINFCDVYDGFKPTESIFYNILKRYYALEISDNPDFLFYSCFGNKFRTFDGCVKIFFSGEDFIPNFNECDYAIGFHPLNFGDRYFRYGFSYNNIKKKPVPKELAKRKFCNFLYSNPTDGRGAIIRQEFFKKLSEYKFIDAPGKVCHNIDLDIEPRDGNWCAGKIDFIKDYKFTIAFENSKTDGYTTEKLFHPFIGQSVPIYWGNRLVSEEFNPKSFINLNDYNDDFDAVIKKIIELDNDDKKYLKMLKEKPLRKNSLYLRQHKELSLFLRNVVEKGNSPFEKDPHNIQARCR